MRSSNKTSKTIIALIVMLLLIGNVIVSRLNPDSNNSIPTEQVSIENYFTSKLTGSESNSEGKYGATLILGDLDSLGRATFAHILVSDDQEPGNNGEKRPGKIMVDPAGWGNYKIDGKFQNDRTHLVGYQFSGINDDVRNLVPALSYLNRGVEGGSGSDQNNPDSMLYYEQILDKWLRENPESQLDLYVKPIYEGNGQTPSQIYMQWVGVSPKGELIKINTGGKAKNIKSAYYAVLLDNASKTVNVDYQTGYVTKKSTTHHLR